MTRDEIHHAERCGFVVSHAEAFAAVAARNDTVILSRCLSPWSTGLIEEHYCSKGFHLKAKTCEWGPMAGFVCEDPCFRKFDRAATESLDRLAAAIAAHQRHNGHSPKDHMAGRIPLEISARRIRFLEVRRKIRVEHGRDSREMMVTADAPFGGELAFQLRYSRVSDRWGIHSVDPASGRTTPVMGMTNSLTRRFIPRPHDYRAAVAGDYDLAALWPKLPYHADSTFAARLLAELNAEIEHRSGYRWWMVHHNYDGGNSISPDVDLPLLVFRPVQGGCRVHTVNTASELAALARSLRELHYNAELNPRGLVHSSA